MSSRQIPHARSLVANTKLPVISTQTQTLEMQRDQLITNLTGLSSENPTVKVSLEQPLDESLRQELVEKGYNLSESYNHREVNGTVEVDERVLTVSIGDTGANVSNNNANTSRDWDQFWPSSSSWPRDWPSWATTPRSFQSTRFPDCGGASKRFRSHYYMSSRTSN